MPVAAASDNGGRYNMVHRQTDDGSVISVSMGDNLTPLVFRYTDYLGHIQESLLSSRFYPHKCLMRGDCGWRRKDDSADLLFSWQESGEEIIGMSSGPSGEYLPITQEYNNHAEDVRLCGLEGHRTVYYRQDREYWAPDKTLEADTVEPFFGWSQYNPNSCPPRQPDKCGIVEYPDGDCNQRKIKYLKNRKEVKENRC